MHLFREDACSMCSGGAGDGIREGTHATLDVTPGPLPALQAPHDMMQQHIPKEGQGIRIRDWKWRSILVKL